MGIFPATPMVTVLLTPMAMVLLTPMVVVMRIPMVTMMRIPVVTWMVAPNTLPRVVLRATRGHAPAPFPPSSTAPSRNRGTGVGHPAFPRLLVLLIALLLSGCTCTDCDEDGFTLEAGDCDDTDAARNPAAEEGCDQLDNDCDGIVDDGLPTALWFQDQDGDGYGDTSTALSRCDAPEGFVASSGDCDDTDPAIHPDAQEICDGVDSNCDGVDDGDLVTTWYVDADEDGYGSSESTQAACAQPEGFTAGDGDCDDTDPAIHPGAEEVCEGPGNTHVDNNCSGEIDEGFDTTWYVDQDGDGYGADTPVQESCAPVDGSVQTPGDCDDTNPALNPAAEEVCDGLDNDCDGLRDEGVLRTWYDDGDGDGFGAPDTGTSSCQGEANQVVQGGDCNDADPATYPGAADVSGDQRDSDCGGHDVADPSLGLEQSVFDSLQAAIDAAPEGTVLWVGPGTWLEHDLTFQGKAMVVASTAGASATTLDAQSEGRVFIFNQGEGPDAQLIGFTLTGGWAWNGGGVLVDEASPTLEDCRIVANAAGGGGGGIHLFQSEAQLRNCQFQNNQAAEDGGGLEVLGGSPVLEGLILEANLAAQGGGLAVTGSSPTLDHLLLSGNQATVAGGGVFLDSSSPTMGHLTVVDNRTEGRAGGIFLTNGANPHLENSILAFNERLELSSDAGEDHPTLQNTLITDAGTSHDLQDIHLEGLDGDPMFFRFVRDGSPFNDDWHLLPGSPARDVVQPQDGDASTDPDESPVDIGYFGGPSADFSGYEDADGDGMPAAWEALFGLDTQAQDGDQDPDGDGASNQTEFEAGTDPGNQDSDGDGFTDGAELNAGSDPLSWHARPGAPDVPFQVPGDFDTIQAAIDAIPPAPASGIIVVGEGTWPESITFNTQTVSMTGSGISTTLLQPEGARGVDAHFSTLTLRDLSIRGAQASDGAGLRLNGVQGELSQLEIQDNGASETGGGVYLSLSSPELRDLILMGNTASSHGGGIFIGANSSPSLLRLVVTDNRAGKNGGGLAFARSSGLVRNLLVVGNQAQGSGGGLALEDAAPKLEQLTLVGNAAEGMGGGLYLRDQARLELVGSVLAFNGGLDLYRADSAGTVSLTYSALYDAGRTHNLADLEDTILLEDPVFAAYSPDGDPLNDDLHLHPTSPLVDAGDPQVLDPDGTRADIGYAGGPAADVSFYADEDRDGMPDGWEVLYGLDPNLDDAEGDLDGDGATNAAELAAGSDPTLADTDGDGFSDGDELAAGSDPLDWHAQPTSEGLVPYEIPGNFATIQEALEAAPGPPLTTLIQVRAGTWSEALHIEGKQITLLAEETGSEGAAVTLEGLETGARILEAHQATLVMRGFTLRGGEADRGGGLLLEDCTGSLQQLMITGNSADYGGGIYLDGSPLELRDCTLSDNQATYDGGGALLLNAAPQISETVFDGNRAGRDGGALLGEWSSPLISDSHFEANEAGEEAGAIGLRYTGSSTISWSEFKGNSAGGDGGALVLDRSEAILSQLVFLSNIAVFNGGGAWLTQASATMDHGLWLDNGAEGDGGALALDGSEVSIIHATLANNRSQEKGGGISLVASSLTLENSLIAFNEGFELFAAEDSTVAVGYSCLFDAGVIHNLEGLDDTVLEENPWLADYSDDADPFNDTFQLAFRSPLRDGGAPSKGDSTRLDPDGSRADIGYFGGSSADFSFYSDGDGDGLEDGWELLVGLDPTVPQPDTADADGDGATEAEEQAAGSSPFVTDTDGDGFDDGTELEAGSDPTDWHSQPNAENPVPFRVPEDFETLAEAIDALPAVPSKGYITLGPGTWTGGVVLERKILELEGREGAEATLVDGRGSRPLQATESTLVLGDLTLTGGSAGQGGGLHLDQVAGTLTDLIVTRNSASNEGGGLSLVASSPTIDGCVFSENNGGYGGGVALMEASAPHWLGGEVRDNSASRHGGGVYVVDATPTLVGVQIIGNVASRTGGGIWTNAAFQMTDCAVEDNQASSEGGGLYISAANPQLEGGSISYNTSGADGGGLFLTASAASLTGMTVAGNSSGDDGGGLFLDASFPTLNNLWITENQARDDGGGLSLASSDPSMINVWIEGNRAVDDGGGLFMTDASPTLHTCVLMDNEASDKGGGVRMDSSSPRFIQLVVSGNVAGEGGGLYVFGEESTPDLVNALIAYNMPENLYNYEFSPGDPLLSYSILYNPEDLENHNLSGLEPSVQAIEPGLLAYDEAGIPAELHLASGSPSIDAGDPELSDVEGGRSDIGAYGGPNGGSWDLDGDGFPDYFWPGSWLDAPNGVDAADFDCDDRDGAVAACF